LVGVSISLDGSIMLKQSSGVHEFSMARHHLFVIFRVFAVYHEHEHDDDYDDDGGDDDEDEDEDDNCDDDGDDDDDDDDDDGDDGGDS
jgi:hypothetical protein